MSIKDISPEIETKLAALLDRYASRPDTGPVSFALSSPSRGWSWSYPHAAVTRPYFTASITKLYTAVVVMQLRQEGLVELGDSIADYLDIDTVAGLNTFHGSDHSAQITVQDLLAHTSGIAGYFDQKRRGSGPLLNEILSADRSWSVDEALDIAKRDMSPRFAPGTPGKAFYSDTNYHLLGLIIEKLTGVSWEQAVKDRILAPLALDDTWAFQASDAGRYDDIATMLYGRAPVRIPLAMASVRAHGGLVSTAEDGLTFLEAFIGGTLFDRAYLAQMRSDWRRILFPSSTAQELCATPCRDSCHPD